MSGLAVMGGWAGAGKAQAQVTLNPDALAHLKAAPPSVAPPTSPKISKPAISRPKISKPTVTKPTVAKPTVAKPAAPVAVTIPVLATAPPEIAKLPPPVAVPVRPVSKPIPPKPVADAPGRAIAIPSGIRLQYDGDSFELNPAMDRALRDFARKSLPGPVALDAFASPNNNDPSTPRRLSLLRALAARAILIDAGLASENIYVRSHAPSLDNAALPADRLDITDLNTHPR
jgi:outer membrane protein OmpA-like peptidoglycan-associated protein